MPKRWPILAATGLTALIVLGDLLLVLGMHDTLIQHRADVAPALARWLLEHKRLICTAKLLVSAPMLLWWLVATVSPARRPRLRLANVAFSGWLATQIITVWFAVLVFLSQVAGFPDGLTADNVLKLLKATEAGWLMPLTLCLPILQLVLGEWAYRSGWHAARAPGSRFSSQAEAA